jgi:hypothetical protein
LFQIWYLREKTQEDALMAWPVERLFYLEEVRQTVLGNKEVIHGSEEEPDN